VGELAYAVPDNSRQPVNFDHESNRLTIGDRSTVVPDSAAGNEAMLRSYLALVAEVRGTPIGSGIEVRHDDVVVLAEILDLADTDLEVHLANLLGVSAKEAADVHGRIRRHRAFAAAFAAALGSIALLSATSVAADPNQPAAAVVTFTPEEVPAKVVVAVPTAPVAEAPVPATAAPATHSHHPHSGDAEIGDALVIVRGEQPDDPNTQIGDAVTYER
jgi:hypothetical protein